jgi:hypothetical protein
MKNILTVAALMASLVSARGSGPSLFSGGQWFKVGVTRSGVYRINQADVIKAGLEAGVDPRKLALYGTSNGMLPQKNSESDGGQLVQIPIVVSGEGDGSFDGNDYILFFGQGPHAHRYLPDKGVFAYETNLYSDYQYYFLTAGETDGLRMTARDSQAGSFPEIAEYEDWIYHEEARLNLLKSGREWFGENVTSAPVTLSFSAGGILAGSTVRFVSGVMAQSADEARFDILMNAKSVGSQPVAGVPQTQYAVKGRVRSDTFRIAAEDLTAVGRSNHSVTYSFVKGASGVSFGNLDYLQVVFTRSLSFEKTPMLFRSAKSLENAVSTFRIGNAYSQVTCWDVTDPFDPLVQQAQLAGTQLSFGVATDELRTFALFDPATVGVPASLVSMANQNLADLVPRTLLIITHPSLQSQAERLGTYRESQGTSALVVKAETIYNEYSGGRQDVSAIRNFIRDIYDRNPVDGLKHVLLFGKGSYDYKNRLGYNLNLVPTYESRNSLSPLETYSSDDYYGFLEPEEGEWPESPPQNHTLDIGVGRIPARNLNEATQAVDKIIQYETDPDAFGRWRNEIAFVADDGDSNIHMSQANQLSEGVETDSMSLVPRKLYLDRYRQTRSGTGERSTEMRHEIDRTAELGALVVNFTGHGNEFQWMQERVLDDFGILEWTNGPVYPFFVTATCEFGRHDDPAFQSAGEIMVLARESGAIGMVSTARPVSSATNFTLNKAFYDALTAKEDGRFRALGDIFRQTKNASASGVSNRNFSLLADPSLVLSFARDSVVITSVTSSESTDTLRAEATVTLSGRIADAGGSTINDFDGVMEVSVFDKPVTRVTRGNENAPYTFSEWDSPVFRGSATVSSGWFSVSFVVPRSINLATGNGRVNFYAVTSDRTGDAAGDYRKLVIGGQASAISGDITGPVISVFMGDSTFLEGSVVAPDVDLVAYFSDASGISVTGADPDFSLVAILDGTDTVALNNYYEAFVDDFTGGVVRFPLYDLSEGPHELVIKAYDTHNNPGMASLAFRVGEGGLQVNTFGNYPNPMTDRSTIYFTHNRPGESLQADWELYGSTGTIIDKRSLEVSESGFRVDLLEFYGEASAGYKIGPGLYIMRLLVRSLRDGSAAESRSKLIVLK